MASRSLRAFRSVAATLIGLLAKAASISSGSGLTGITVAVERRLGSGRSRQSGCDRTSCRPSPQELLFRGSCTGRSSRAPTRPASCPVAEAGGLPPSRSWVPASSIPRAWDRARRLSLPEGSVQRDRGFRNGLRESWTASRARSPPSLSTEHRDTEQRGHLRDRTLCRCRGPGGAVVWQTPCRA